MSNEQSSQDTPQAEAIDVQKVADRYLAAWRDRDPDRIIAMHTPDTCFELHVGKDTYVDAAHLRAALA